MSQERKKTNENPKIASLAGRYSQVFFQIVFDSIGILFATLTQFYLRYGTGKFGTRYAAEITEIVIVSSVMLFYWLALFFFSGLYKKWYERSPFEEIFTILRTTIIGSAIIAFFVISDSQNSPRLLILIYFALLFVSVSFGRIASRRIQKKMRSKRIISIPSIIIGTPKKAAELYRKTEASPAWGYKAVGIMLTNTTEATAYSEEFRNLVISNELDELPKVIEHYKPEAVLVATEKPDHDSMLEIANISGNYGIRVKIEPDLYDIFTGQAKTNHIYGIPLIEISTQLLEPWQQAVKRIFDIVFSLCVIVLGMPFWLAIAIAIKVETRGPVFYKQPRVTLNEEVFYIYKFRSMVVDADKKGLKWTSVNDPRVTKVGRIIRKTHLDEIPQFFNVLKGDMSVVGPRPEQPQFVKEFSEIIPYYKRRLKVRPGITGWWQVKYREHELNNEEISNRLKDDFFYIENMSIKLDIEIIIRTVWCVFKGHGQA